MHRYAFRCKHCLSVVFLDTEDEYCSYSYNAKSHELHFAFQGQMLCPCDGRFEEMGRVELEKDKETGHVISTELRAPCDARCTHAVGPKCTCRCNACNHGSGRVVTVDRVTYRIKATDGVITDEAIEAGRRYAQDVDLVEAVMTKMWDTLQAGWDRELSFHRSRLYYGLQKIRKSRSLRHRSRLMNEALGLAERFV
jgi:hypothetical protein